MVTPPPSLASTLALANPVALDANAEERDTRGFISITTTRPLLALMPNCTLEPPVSTPILRKTAIEASRRRWYSLSVRVCAGATVIERSEEHTSELQSLMRISYAVFCLKKKKKKK